MPAEEPGPASAPATSPPEEPQDEALPPPTQPAAGGAEVEQGAPQASEEPVAESPAGEPPADDPGASEEPRGTSLFSPGSAGYYALYYGADWAFVALSAGLMAGGAFRGIRPPLTLLGPSFDEKDPDLKALDDPRLDATIGRPFLREKVPIWALAAAGGGAIVAFGTVDTFARQDFHHTHALVLGAATAAMAAFDFSELLKLSFGRLRPDFRERYRRAACGGAVRAPPDLDCSAVATDGFVLDERELIDGYKSFPSGHASTSFALASYFSLYLGSEWIWGERATSLSQPIATLAAGALLSGALFASASRIADHRHHPEDVAVGAALGAAVGAASYFLHFDLDGEARWRGVEVVPQVMEGGGGVALSGRF